MAIAGAREECAVSRVIDARSQTRDIRSRYVLACDGAGIRVRESQGIGMNTGIADVQNLA